MSLSLGSQCCRYLLVSSICLSVSLSLSLWAVSAVDISSSLVYVSLSLSQGRSVVKEYPVYGQVFIALLLLSALSCVPIAALHSFCKRKPLRRHVTSDAETHVTSSARAWLTSSVLGWLYNTLVQKTSCWDLNIIFPSENMIKDDQKRPFFLWHFT